MLQGGCWYNYEAYHGVRRKKPLAAASAEVMKQEYPELRPLLPLLGGCRYCYSDFIVKRCYSGIQISEQLGIPIGLFLREGVNSRARGPSPQRKDPFSSASPAIEDTLLERKALMYFFTPHFMAKQALAYCGHSVSVCGRK